MVAIKAGDVARFLSQIDARYEAILIYGPDEGLVAERAKLAAHKLASFEDPPGEVIRIDDADLEGDPDRLIVEVQTLPMFSSAKVVRTSSGRRVTAAVLKPLLEGPKLAARLIVTAGNLKADEGLRPLFDKSPRAAALPCYADETRDLDALVRDTLKEFKLDISAEARDALTAMLGADRGLSRAEIEKLMLYAQGKPRIELEDVEAIVGDASEIALDRVVMAACQGDANRALMEYDRAISGGEGAQSILLAFERHLLRLDRLRAGLDKGQGFEDASRAIRPPLHFKLKGAIEAQLRVLTRPRLTRAMAIASTAIESSRLGGLDEDTLAARAVMEIAGLTRVGPARRV